MYSPTIMKSENHPAQPDNTPERSDHTFHIPVMGSGFTIDTPLNVARYGISSVVSLVDDVIIEQLRKFHCQKANEPYEEIKSKDEDSRARRITAYLNLLDKLVKHQVKELQASPFENDSEITRYYRLLPDSSKSKQLYKDMLACNDPSQKETMQNKLRKLAVPGSIDVNIMTKLNCARYQGGQKLSKEFNDAMSALRGYAESKLDSAIVFSAGLNQQIYTYITEFKDFFIDKNDYIKKKIVLKVSDYRSASIQGKLLAKTGLWVSEYRVESGLNCGGHTFPGKGYMMGPILEEFQKKKIELIEKLHSVYNKALARLKMPPQASPHNLNITVQGGIGTADEDQLLLKHFGVNATGWATPFMLTPEVARMDDENRQRLMEASGDDIFLSKSSPIGVPFWNMRTSSSEEARRARIAAGKPGSACPKKFLCFDEEFTDRPICKASRAYQEKKLVSLETEDLTNEQCAMLKDDVLAKSCLCHDLGGNVTRPYGIDPEASPAVCCGPNIRYFSKLTTLEEMVDHIYGRISLLTNMERPHIFVQEITIYIQHMETEIERFCLKISDKKIQYFEEFRQHLLNAVDCYTKIAKETAEEQRDRLCAELQALQKQINAISLDLCPATT